MRVIGIDPGLRSTGWGVIDQAGARLSHVANGQCRSTGDTLAARLMSLHDQLTDIIAEHGPTAAAVEQTFVNRDAAGTL
ncbi:MAG: crossover junction endodeoxyribonuclease RuvC, partial [Pseudomonadota bacterium]